MYDVSLGKYIRMYMFLVTLTHKIYQTLQTRQTHANPYPYLVFEGPVQRTAKNRRPDQTLTAKTGPVFTKTGPFYGLIKKSQSKRLKNDVFMDFLHIFLKSVAIIT
jgi:hypothetical protein